MAHVNGMKNGGMALFYCHIVTHCYILRETDFL